MPIISLFPDSKKLLIVFGAILLINTYPIINNTVYSAELGTYILSEIRTNKSVSIVKNLSREESTKKCEDDKKNNP